MPVYEYVCSACGHEYEELAGMSRRDAQRHCPMCGRKGITRKFSTFSAQQGRKRAAAPPSCGMCSDEGTCPRACGYGQ